MDHVQLAVVYTGNNYVGKVVDYNMMVIYL